MALLNRPLTEAEFEKMLDLAMPSMDFQSFFAGQFEPRQQFVRYDAAVPRIVYEDPATFYWTTDDTPSDNRWMVPGVTLGPHRW